MDPISQFIVEVAKQLGLSPVAAALLIPMTVMIAARIARVIPDTAEGPLKWIRLVCKFIGMYPKDNSGVGGLLLRSGEVLAQADPANRPEGIDERQQILELDTPLNTFKSANEAISARMNS